MTRLENNTVVMAKRLTKIYGDREAVRGIDFEVGRGEFVGFLGPNGAGKTTTMRMIGCSSPRSSGDLTVFGCDPEHSSARIRARLGVVPQHDNLDDELTVRQNLYIYGRLFGLRKRIVAERANALLDFVQLSERAGASVDSLSGGMKRRLTIARALISQPEIVLLDEPTTGLDPQARHLVWERLYRLKSEGVTMVLTTHYMDEAEQLCDQLFIMDEGRIVASGSPQSLIQEHCTREVLELRMRDGETRQAQSAAERFADRIEVLPDRLLVYASSGEQALSQLRDEGIRPINSLVRRSSLEDVFLRLTGRRLNE